MNEKPVAAGKSSLDLVDNDLVFSEVIVDPDGTYLDMACGVGRYTVELAGQLNADATVHAFDLWEEGIAELTNYAKQHDLKSIKAKLVDITAQLPLQDSTIDVCLMATALHDLPESTRSGVVEEVSRVISPGGFFILIEFKKVNYGPGPDIDERIGESDADELVLPHGFTKKNVVDLGEFTYLIKYMKK
ncbi:Ubiquinone/menaquinone biosynthesis C-methyltransferase UbiE [Pseudodesulfovibrio profundus]|uniref:Ubiquinone/menaquinone biosynthesis C-methyltransferase UbiE n=1 Tax=Pseudodesulfovibrio profundus TaxID=57320 RepID=A0A2C8F3M7_9BACT|nr:class I SAM-dependent methyltransferase [Pseudodesulfovibrio profundus]SOB57141.1 Ubiquinone/menaquinone biosynthesis C-methyltransferase UbiE [Pseudodesulfovibrio profundus]|tara:strand:+ start:721 stop:1287 length:567 start_codon:yes stop_codon:yes gene_type:complete